MRGDGDQRGQNSGMGRERGAGDDAWRVPGTGRKCLPVAGPGRRGCELAWVLRSGCCAAGGAAEVGLAWVPARGEMGALMEPGAPDGRLQAWDEGARWP